MAHIGLRPPRRPSGRRTHWYTVAFCGRLELVLECDLRQWQFGAFAYIWRNGHIGIGAGPLSLSLNW